MSMAASVSGSWPPPLWIWGADLAAGGPEASHIFLTLAFALAFFFVRLILDRLLFQPVAAWIFSGKASRLLSDEARFAKIVKFSESMWKLAYYGSAQLWVLSIIKQEPWSLDTKEYFRGWPNQELKLSLMLFYTFQGGFYMYSIGALLAWETRRKDFAVMMSHHIVTSILIAYSYLTRFFRIGVIILALHDTSDVFLEAAKLFKYSGKELAASLLFGLFALSWLVLRLIYFPFWIIRSSGYESIICLTEQGNFSTFMYYNFNTMLFTLLVFHMYWWKLITLMIKKQLRNKGQVGDDVRSDSDGD